MGVVGGAAATTAEEKPPVLPIDMICRTLFDSPQYSTKLRKRYHIEQDISGQALRDAIAETFAECVTLDRSVQPTLADIFKAGVLAIGSNSRPWHLFLGNLPKISDALYHFDAIAVKNVTSPEEDRRKVASQIKKLLGGITAGRDSTSILTFATSLASNPTYADDLKEAGDWFRHFLNNFTEHRVLESSVTICVALLLGNKACRRRALFHNDKIQKIDGMGVTLATEFLRNLGWPAFKPDRHIRETLSHWYTPETRTQYAGPIAQRVAQAFGGLTQLDLELVEIAALGAVATPPAMELNVADQLVWLYRATVGRIGLSTLSHNATEHKRLAT